MHRYNHVKLFENRHKIRQKWIGPVLVVLYKRPEKFNKIKSILKSISNKVLAKTLGSMKLHGMAYKNTQGRYFITPLGIKLVKAWTAFLNVVNELP
jgi:DNA-binding HxlR family transcriptional regulator